MIREAKRTLGRRSLLAAATAMAACAGDKPKPKPKTGKETPALVSGKPPKKHVLFISIDDLNDWVGVLGGHPQTITPNIDALAKSGTLFTNAHCASPACNPSRTAVMTGLHPTSTGVYENGQPWRKALPDRLTLPQVFRQGGYRAEGAGKIFHHPDAASWDAYYPSICTPRPSSKAPPKRPAEGLTANFDWAALDVTDDQMADAVVAKYVSERLARPLDGPTFLACGFFRPHLPWYAPKRYFDPFPIDQVKLPEVRQGDLDDLPSAGRATAKPKGDHRKITERNLWPSAVRAYLASVHFVDDMVGRVMHALESGPNRDETVVVLWSDHGFHLGEKLHWRKFGLWEEATRVPLVVRDPGRPAQECGRAVSILDLYPTLSELCDLATPQNDGHSLVPLMDSAVATRPRPVLTSHSSRMFAVRDDRYRYIRYADGGEELYDHSSDPNEWTNLASTADPAIKARLAARIPTNAAPPARHRREFSKEELRCK